MNKLSTKQLLITLCVVLFFFICGFLVGSCFARTNDSEAGVVTAYADVIIEDDQVTITVDNFIVGYVGSSLFPIVNEPHSDPGLTLILGRETGVLYSLEIRYGYDETGGDFGVFWHYLPSLTPSFTTVVNRSYSVSPEFVWSLWNARNHTTYYQLGDWFVTYEMQNLPGNYSLEHFTSSFTHCDLDSVYCGCPGDNWFDKLGFTFVFKYTYQGSDNLFPETSYLNCYLRPTTLFNSSTGNTTILSRATSYRLIYPDFVMYHNDNFQSGYNYGFRAGYEAGLSVGNTDNMFSKLVSLVDGFLRINILPGVTFGMILAIPFGVLFISLVIKLFFGG